MERRIIATKNGYVRRLRQMVGKDEICNHCPKGVGFSGSDSHDTHKSTCQWCTDFVDLEGTQCPCIQSKHNGEDPLECAHKALAEWDAGTHKWQKEVR